MKSMRELYDERSFFVKGDKLNVQEFYKDDWLTICLQFFDVKDDCIPFVEKESVYCRIEIYVDSLNREGETITENRDFTFNVYGDEMIPINHIMIGETEEQNKQIENAFKELAKITNRSYVFQKCGIPQFYMDKHRKHNLDELIPGVSKLNIEGAFL